METRIVLNRPASFRRLVSTRKNSVRLAGLRATRVSAVLAPAEVNTRKRGNESRHQPGYSRGLAGVLLAALRAWERQSPQQSAPPEDLLAQAAERGHEVVRVQENSGSRKSAPLPPSIDPFLRPVGILELRYIRMLSNLCALTYFMSKKLSPKSLEKRHGLRLVTSSMVCEVRPKLAQMSPLQAIVDGDATAADVPHIIATREEEVVKAVSEAAAVDSPAMQVITKVEPLAAAKQSQSPTDMVANSLAAAAAAAATAASSAAGSVYSAAAPIAAPIASNISAFTSSATTPLASVASQLQNAAAAGQASTVATLATVSAAMMSGNKPTPAQQQCISPTEWFVADDDSAHMRYFVIQGSDTMDHWRVNLTFDPVQFEDKALGVKVHRGVYETAMILYDRFLPMVQEHVASSPQARIAFTGHSLGGSLATLLMMMYLRRGVVTAENLAPVYTFGSPAIFCEGTSGPCGADCGACSITPGEDSSNSSTAGGILDKLELPSGAIRNVMMHKDIVPRAFACDYSLVADILRRVGESFREHKCLSGDRRVMFNFVGKMMVLQPAAESNFVAQGEGYHPMLPQQPGMFIVREPNVLQGVAAHVHRDVRVVKEGISNLAVGSQSSMAVNKSPTKPRATAQSTVASADEAVWQLMNSPHPLDILADTGAYGDSGSISRYHNPDNYTKAIGGVLRARGTTWRSLVNKAEQSGVRFKPSALAPTVQRCEQQQQHDPAPPPSPNAGGKMHSPLAARPNPRRHEGLSPASHGA